MNIDSPIKILIVLFLFTNCFSDSLGTFLDSRDNQEYNWVKIGNQIWMAQNLNYNSGTGSNCEIGDSTANSTYGCLYDWTTAMGIDSSFSSKWYLPGIDSIEGVCPDGWYVPNVENWKELKEFVGNNNDDEGTGVSLKSKFGWTSFRGKSGNGTNRFGFNALGAGTILPDGEKEPVGYKAHFWSSNQTGPSSSHFYYIWSVFDYFEKSEGSKKESYSVRCIKRI